MELNVKLDKFKLEKLNKVTKGEVIYCIPTGLDRKGNFNDDCFVGATAEGIFVFEGEELEFHPFKDCETVTHRAQTNGAIVTVKKNGYEYLLARCNLRNISLLASFARGARLLIEGNTKRVINNDREKYCPKCGRVLPGTANCPKCDKSGQNIKRFVDLCRPHFKSLIAVSVLMLVDGFISISQQGILRIFLDKYLIGGNGTLWDVLTFLAIYLAVIIVGLVIFYVKAHLCGRLGVKVAHNLRGKLSQHLQKMSLTFLTGRSTGEVVERVSGDTARIRDFIGNSLCSSFSQVVMLTSLSIIMLIMNWRLALATFIFIPFVLIFTKTFWPKIRKIFHHQWRKTDSIQNKLQDVLSGIRIVKTYGKEKNETDKFCRLNEDLAGVTYRNEKFYAIFYPTITLILSFSTYLIVYLGGSEVLAGSMTPGELMQFVAYAGMLLGPISWMSFLPRQIVNMITSMERIYDVLDEKPQITSKSDAPKAEIKGDIRFEKVVFGYHTHSPVLDGVSIDVKAGEMIGLVGASGSGKSTLINLIMRLYDVDEGGIYIDGIDLRDIDVATYHSQIGVVLQETFLFAGSVLDNIRFAKPEADMREVILAAKAANAHDFICKLPDGYNTYVGEKGHKLSGGEKQRIAIARAILNDPKLLILDEATSALDTESEYQVQQALDRLRKGRTTFAIAHRLSTLRGADRLAVIDDHKIAEIGTHNELIRQKGIYYSLVMAQLQMSKTNKD